MIPITSLSQLDLNKRYTYADYIQWQFEERVELLKGSVWPMPMPSPIHQEILGNLGGFLWLHLHSKKKCKVYMAPFDVCLPFSEHETTKDKIDTVVQPDLSIICDLSKIMRQCCLGAPDLVIEILSPSNASREMRDKYELYEAAGVLEYWIVDPNRRSVLVYTLKEGRFSNVSHPLTDEYTLKSVVFPDLAINLAEVFPEEEQKEEEDEW